MCVYLRISVTVGIIDQISKNYFNDNIHEIYRINAWYAFSGNWSELKAFKRILKARHIQNLEFRLEINCWLKVVRKPRIVPYGVIIACKHHLNLLGIFPVFDIFSPRGHVLEIVCRGGEGIWPPNIEQVVKKVTLVKG